MIAELLLSMSAIITGSTFDGFPHQSPSIKIDGHKGSYNHDNCFPWEWKRNQGSYRYTLHAVHIWEHEYAHAKGYHPYEKEADSVHEIYAHGWQKSSGFLPHSMPWMLLGLPHRRKNIYLPLLGMSPSNPSDEPSCTSMTLLSGKE